MKWRLCLLVLLFFLALGAVAYAASEVQGEADSVTVTHTLLAGDPAAAKGLVMKWHGGDDTLRWDTTYELGTQPVCRTDFSFRGIWAGYNWEPSGYIFEFATFPAWYSYESESELTYHYLTLELKNETGFMARLVNDVTSRMEPGVFERSEHLRVSDYYDNYPLYENGSYLLDSKGQNAEAFQSYFSIPIPEDFWLDVTVHKDLYDNRLSAVFLIPFRAAAPTLQGIRLEDTVYFYFLSTDGKLDFSQVKDGPGIYQVPYRQKALPIIDATALECVYPLASPKTQIEYLKLSQDLKAFFLVTREEDSQVFHILWRDTMEPMAEVVLPEGAPLQAIYQVPGTVPNGAEGYLTLFEDNSFCFFITDAHGGLIPKFRGTLTLDGAQDIEQRFSTAAYDGARLAVLGKDPDSKALYLQIYDARGLSYAGGYDSSLWAFGYEDGESLDRYDPRWEPRDLLSQNYQLIWQQPAR